MDLDPPPHREFELGDVCGPRVAAWQGSLVTAQRIEWDSTSLGWGVARAGGGAKLLVDSKKPLARPGVSVERTTGFEPATLTLAR